MTSTPGWFPRRNAAAVQQLQMAASQPEDQGVACRGDGAWRPSREDPASAGGAVQAQPPVGGELGGTGAVQPAAGMVTPILSSDRRVRFAADFSSEVTGGSPEVALTDAQGPWARTSMTLTDEQIGSTDFGPQSQDRLGVASVATPGSRSVDMGVSPQFDYSAAVPSAA